MIGLEEFLSNPVVFAVRIYLNNRKKCTADLILSDGTYTTIDWMDITQREHFMRYMNGSTVFYDERPKPLWNEMKEEKNSE